MWDVIYIGDASARGPVFNMLRGKPVFVCVVLRVLVGAAASRPRLAGVPGSCGRSVRRETVIRC